MMRASLALALIAAAPAAAVDLPPRAPGQWEMSIQVDTAAMPPQVIRMCLDAEADRLLHDRLAATARETCGRDDQRTDGGDLVLDSECRVGGVTTTAHTVVSGDFSSAYTMRTETRVSGASAAPQGPGSQAITISARRIGACAADARPGDVDFGTGAKFNLKDPPAASH